MGSASDLDLEEQLLLEENVSEQSDFDYPALGAENIDPYLRNQHRNSNNSDDAYFKRNRDDDLDLASELPPQEGAPFGLYLASDGQYRARQLDPEVGRDADEGNAKTRRAERRQELAQSQLRQVNPPANRLLIEEESSDESDAGEDSQAVPINPGRRAPVIPDMIPDIEGGRDMQAKTKKWDRVAEVGSTIQGKTNTARMRGEGRYGAATAHGVGNFLAKTGEGAAGITAAAALPLNLAGTLASPVKATASKLLGAVGQTVEGVSDFAKNRIDPEALGEQQSLVDLANRHNLGNDTAGGGSGMNRRDEADAYGIRFEKGDQAKSLWKGRKKRSAGRIAENFLSAPLRGIASVPMGIWKGAKAVGGLFANTLPKYGRKFGKWLGKNRFSTARRGRKGFENMMAIGDRDQARTRQDAAYLERDIGMMAQKHKNDDPNRIAKMSWLRKKIFGTGKEAWRGKDDPRAWRGTESQVRSAARTHLHATGRDLMLGRKEFNSLDAYKRKMYKEVERNRVQNSPEYQRALDTQSTEAINIVRQKMSALAPEESDRKNDEEASQAEPRLIQDADPGEDFEKLETPASNPDLVPHETKNSTSALMATGQFLDEKVNTAKEKMLKVHKGAAQILPVAKFMGEKVPAMLNSDPALAEGYAPIQQGAQDVGNFIDTYVKKPMDDVNALTGVKQLPLVPLVSDGMALGADLIQTGAQYKHRNDDPNATGQHQRQGMKDLRAMLDTHRALEDAESENGVTEAQRKARVRRKLRTVMRLALANKNLAKAQTKAGLTSKNEYSHKQEEFISSGTFEKDKTENSRLYNTFSKMLGKKNAADPVPQAVHEDLIADNSEQSEAEQRNEEPINPGAAVAPGPRPLSMIPEDENESLSDSVKSESAEENHASRSSDHALESDDFSHLSKGAMPASRRYSQGHSVERPTSFTNIEGLDFDQPLDDFMYEPEEVEHYQNLLRKEAARRGQEDFPMPSHHKFVKGMERDQYPNLKETEKVKRVLNDANETNQVNPDIAKHSGPSTVAGHEVYPEYGGVDEPHAPFGGDWRDLATNQVLQHAGRTGEEEEEYREFRGEAVPEDRVLELPAEGWDELGSKPGLFAGKKAKAEYQQRKAAATKVVGEAHRKVDGGAMPDFIKASAFGRKNWKRADEQRQLQQALLRARIQNQLRHI